MAVTAALAFIASGVGAGAVIMVLVAVLGLATVAGRSSLNSLEVLLRCLKSSVVAGHGRHVPVRRVRRKPLPPPREQLSGLMV